MPSLYGPVAIRYPNGRPASGEEIEVRKLDGTPAALYSDSIGTPRANPVVLDKLANLSFYAAPGAYNLVANEFTIRVSIADGGGGGSSESLQIHIDSSNPHPNLDIVGVDFNLLYENAKV